MDVAVSDLRANLSTWLARARDGEDVVVTDRGVPVARLTGVDTGPTIERLTELGAIGRPAGRRPRASGRSKPVATRPIADTVGEHRR